MQDAKEEVRARIAIEDVVGEYVQLKRAGRNFKGLSPFSAEKTPSFFVSPDKNIWHDFSSNKGGDVFSFVMEVEGLDFLGALELLARRAGVDLSVYDSKGAQETAKRKRRLLEMHDLAARYYQQSLLSNMTAIEYVFKKRKLSKEVVTQFRIGYATGAPDALVQFLKRRGFSQQEIALGGLTNRRGGDLFRSRMMVPLMDASGQVIGFTGRIIEDIPNAPKYLNTPQTPLYDKGRHVFGLSQAKEKIRTSDQAVIVEGNLDVISSHQVGVSQVVATAGTAMTEGHLKALSRLTPNIRLAFDGDAAGLAATERAIDIAQKVGVELTIVSLPDDVKDPDELIQKDVSLWQQAIDGARPVVDWLFIQYGKREDMTTPLGKRRFTTAALTVVSRLTDEVERDHYINQIATDTQVSVEAVREKLATLTNPEPEPVRKVAQETEVSVDPYSYQDNLLALGLVDLNTRGVISELEEVVFPTDERRAVFHYITKTGDTVVDVPKGLQDFETYVKILLLKADARYGQWSDDDRLLEATRLVRLAKTEQRKTQKETLTAELRHAEDVGDEVVALRLRRQLNDLIKEDARAKR